MTRRYERWKPNTTPPADDRVKPVVVSIWCILFRFLIGGMANDQR